MLVGLAVISLTCVPPCTRTGIRSRWRGSGGRGIGCLKMRRGRWIDAPLKGGPFALLRAARIFAAVYGRLAGSMSSIATIAEQPSSGGACRRIMCRRCFIPCTCRMYHLPDRGDGLRILAITTHVASAEAKQWLIDQERNRSGLHQPSFHTVFTSINFRLSMRRGACKRVTNSICRPMQQSQCMSGGWIHRKMKNGCSIWFSSRSARCQSCISCSPAKGRTKLQFGSGSRRQGLQDRVRLLGHREAIAGVSRRRCTAIAVDAGRFLTRLCRGDGGRHSGVAHANERNGGVDHRRHHRPIDTD